MKTIIDFANKVRSLADGRISNIANVEESPSTHPYTVGKQLIFNGLLCKATSAIAVGDTLAVGTNLVLADNVVEQIYSLNQGLTNSLNNEITTRAKLGGHNLFKVAAETLTIQGVTFTRNSDGSFTVNGTASGNIYYNLTLSKFLKFEDLDYILTGCPSGGSEDSYSLFIRSNEADSSQWQYAIDYGNGISFLADSSREYVAFIYVKDGYTISNKIFYPMVRLATDESADYEPYSMTNREMTSYVQSIRNPNLLDNPWFTVNQRGQSSYSSGYTVDRWMKGYGDVICNVTNDGITLSSSILGSNFVQFIEEDFYNKFIAGKYLTVSVLLTDGTIKSSTGYAPVNTSYYQNAAFMYITNTCTLTVIGKTGENEQVQLRFAEANSDSVSIRAIKLELGSVSTLAMDTAPNYQQELAKCQRYFQRIKSNQNGMQPFYTIATSSSSLRGLLILQENMRNKPTITISDITGITLYNSGTPKQVNSLAIENIDVNNRYVKLTMAASDVAINAVYAAEIANGVYIDFSADL